MKGWRRVLLGTLVTGCLAASGSVALWAGPTGSPDKNLSQKRKDLNEIRRELSQKKEKEKEIRGKETSVLENLSDLETQLYKKSKELKKIETHLAKTKEKLDQTKGQVTTLTQGMGQTREELHSRLSALYKIGRIPPRAFLLTSESYLDLLRLDKYMRAIIDSDSQLVSTYRQQVSLKERYHEELIQDQRQLQRSISEVEQKKEEIKKVREEKRVLLRSIQGEKAVTQRVIAELEGRAKDLQGLIDRLEKERTLLAHPGKRKSDTVSFKGKLTPPVEGSVISHFKEKGQNGIEIKAPMESEVRAVLPGKVMFADWFKGFGNMLIIDHGSHTFTVSAYCSQLLKREGDTVTQGEPVALVGSAGSLKGPCLYFEIRHRGKAQNPVEWISSPERTVSVQEASKNAKKGL